MGAVSLAHTHVAPLQGSAQLPLSHSCEPNCWFSFPFGSLDAVLIVTRREIEAGTMTRLRTTYMGKVLL